MSGSYIHRTDTSFFIVKLLVVIVFYIMSYSKKKLVRFTHRTNGNFLIKIPKIFEK